MNFLLTSIHDSVTVAGVTGAGDALNQLRNPWGLYVDDDQTVYVADCSNHRIMVYNHGVTTGRVLFSHNAKEEQQTQLNGPKDLTIDKTNKSFIISDYNNERIVRWCLQSNAKVETIVSNTRCHGLAIDDRGFLYVVDENKHEVRRYKMGENQGTIVAGGNGQGHGLNQLSNPTYIFVDKKYSVFVSDTNNHRVMKWREGAKYGTIVAGSQSQGDGLNQLSYPYGIVVDALGTLYVADCLNNRIMSWIQGHTEGSVFVGGRIPGTQLNELCGPVGLSLDVQGNLYVSESRNNRVRRFNIRRIL